MNKSKKKTKSRKKNKKKNSREMKSQEANGRMREAAKKVKKEVEGRTGCEGRPWNRNEWYEDGKVGDGGVKCWQYYIERPASWSQP